MKTYNPACDPGFLEENPDELTCAHEWELGDCTKMHDRFFWYCVKCRAVDETSDVKPPTTEAEELAEHCRANNIKGHSINADGSCNMGCC